MKNILNVRSKDYVKTRLEELATTRQEDTEPIY